MVNLTLVENSLKLQKAYQIQSNTTLRRYVVNLNTILLNGIQNLAKMK